MDFNKFKPRVRAYIDKHFSSVSEASRHYGHHTSYLLRCLGGQRSFPTELLDDMGYEVTKTYTPSYTKKKSAPGEQEIFDLLEQFVDVTTEEAEGRVVGKIKLALEYRGVDCTGMSRRVLIKAARNLYNKPEGEES